MANRNYGGVIWTNHAIQRLNERRISQGDAWAVWNRPEQSRYSTTKGAWIYYKTYGDQRIEVVAKQNEKKEWVVLSVWSKKVSESRLRNTDNFWIGLLKKIVFKQK